MSDDETPAQVDGRVSGHANTLEQARDWRTVTLSRRAHDGCVVPLKVVDAEGVHHELSESDEHRRIHRSPQYARDQQTARAKRAGRRALRFGEGAALQRAPSRPATPEAPDPERVRSSLRLHELATSLQRRDSSLSYKGAVLAASRIHDSQPDGAFEPVDDDRAALHREAEAYRIAHEVSYKEALYAVDRRRASELPAGIIATAPIDDNAELHAAAVVRMAREPGMSYRDALMLEARTPPSATAGKVRKIEDAAPTEDEVTAFMKQHGGSYRSALIALMTAAATAQKEA